MSHFTERLGEEALLLSQDPLTKLLSVHFTFFYFHLINIPGQPNSGPNTTLSHAHAGHARLPAAAPSTP
jgi:hypothetical protein